MAGFAELHLTGAVGAALEALGYRADAPEVRDVVPTAARGHNLLLVAPPAAVHAVPALAGAVVHAAGGGEGLRLLVLTPETGIAGFRRAVVPLAAAAGLRVHAATTPARAARRLRDGSADLLITTPDNALALLERSALKGSQLRTLFLAWPEQYADLDALAPLMGEIAKDTQRIIHTADSAQVTDLVERYARRAHTVGVDPAGAPVAPLAGTVRTVIVAESGRDEALRAVIEMLDPERVNVWAADAGARRDAEAALAPVDATAVVSTGDAASGGLVIAYDLPTRARLEQLLTAGEVVMLLPPHAEPWLAGLVRGRRPLRPADLLDRARDEAARRRGLVSQRIEAGVPPEALYALAPLFERYDGAEVAGALYELWHAAAAQQPASAPVPVVMPASETGKMWVGVGSIDGVTPNDLVAALVKDLKFERSRIGKIEIREKFSLVELPASDVEAVAAGLTGKSVRRRRVVARADRGATPRGDTPRGDRARSAAPRKPRPRP